MSKNTLKHGFGKYVTNIRIPIPADTKFALEAVTINHLHSSQPNNSTIFQKARSYIENYLYQRQLKFNEDKKIWIAQAKNQTYNQSQI